MNFSPANSCPLLRRSVPFNINIMMYMTALLICPPHTHTHTHSPLETSSEWLVVDSVAEPEQLQLEASKFMDFDIDEVCMYAYMYACMYVCTYVQYVYICRQS